MVLTVRAVACLCLCLTVCQVRGSHIPAEMNRTIQNLLQHYRIPREERYNRKPVFSREPLTGKTESQRVFMGGVLETYEKILGLMLNQLPTPSPVTNQLPNAGAANDAETGGNEDLRPKLNFILKKVHDLRKNEYQEQERLLQNLDALKNIKMENNVVQSKALWELPWLYEEASSLSKAHRQERRRRQAWRAKSHARG
ncbi:interferon gamma-like [Cheilinus undulatus]|uniref:interferon gamma-like n=1 Tax=Cheilinus undulatus TaxID=241271 RepID=UPI001BD3D1ED|nr:interferon gamma-like [Cheilinus undulatus]